MAKKTDVIKLTDDDFKGKSFKVAPAGKYQAKFNSKSKIKPGKNGNILNTIITITKGEHKGVNIFDNIAPHVGWKIAQLLKSLGIKKMPKKLTLQQLLDMLKKHGKDIRAIIKVEMYQGKKQNKVVQYLPLTSGDDEDEDDDDIDEADDEDDENDDDADDDDEDDSDDDESDDDDDDDDEDEDEDDDADSDDDDDEEDDDDEDEDEGEDEDEDDEDDDDDVDDADDEDDEAPRRKKTAKKPAKKPVKKPAKRGAKRK